MTSVAFLIDRFEYETAGTERQMLRLARELMRNDVQLRIVSLRDASRLRALLPGVEVQELGIGSLRELGGWMRAYVIMRRLRKHGVDVVHCWFNDSSLLWPPLARSLGFRVVVSRRDLGFWYTPGRLRWLRAINGLVDVVVANSDAVRGTVIQYERYRPGQVRVIRNGVWDADRAASSYSESEGARVLPPGRWIVAVANLRPLKRLDLVIRALAMIEEAHPDVRLAIVGADKDDGGRSHTDDLRQLAEELGVTGKVRFVGSQRDPWRYLEESTVCVLASDTEGLSNSLVEYALAERPIACSDIAANREVVVDGETGLLFEPGSGSDLARALDVLLSKPDFAAALAARAGRLAREQFSVECMVRQHCEMYRELTLLP